MLVVGLARTGVATALFCAARNAIVTATETRTEASSARVVAKLREAGVRSNSAATPKRLFSSRI